MQKVNLYIRHSGSRKYKKLTNKAMFAGGNFPPGTIFVLRYVRNGKRCFETLNDCPNLMAAQRMKLERELDLLKGKVPPAPAPRPTTKPTLPPAAKPGELRLDSAIDKYLANVAVRSGKTQSGYGYTMKQFFVFCGNKAMASIARQDLIDFEAYLRGEGLADRTVHNRIAEVITLLRHFGFKEVKHTVKYVEKKVRAYRPDELRMLGTHAQILRSPEEP